MEPNLDNFMLENGNEIFTDLLNKVRSISSFQDIGDGLLQRIIHIDFTEEKMAKSEKDFYYNYGRMADGLKYRLNESSNYFKVTTNLLLLNRGERSTVQKANTRSANNRPSIIVYVNGLKIPDSEIYMYMTDSNTDILLPMKYFNRNVNNKIVVEKRKYSDYDYAGYYNDFKSYTGTVRFNLSSHRNHVQVNKDTCLVFNKGMYINDNINEIFRINDEIVIDFIEQIDGIVEVFIDSSITGHFKKTLTDTAIATFVIPDSFRDPLYGPIGKDNCIFMINGLRVSNNDIEAAGRLNFEYHYPEIQSTLKCDILYIDLGKQPDINLKIYGSDYYLYNMIGVDAVTDALSTGVSGTIFDNKELIDYDKIFNNDLTMYDYTKTKEFIDGLSGYSNLLNRIFAILDTRPHLMRDFLSHFGSKRIVKTLKYDGTGDKSLAFPKIYDIGVTITRLIYINGSYYSSEFMNIVDHSNQWYMTIPGDVLITGDNKIQIIEYHQKTTTKYFEELKPTLKTNTLGESHYMHSVPLFGNIELLSDMIVMEMSSSDDDNGVYASNSKYGFKIMDSDLFTISIIDRVITIDFGNTKPTKPVIICSKHAFCKIKISITGELTYDTMMHAVNIGVIKYTEDDGTVVDVPIPITHDGSILAFTNNGERLFDLSDFLYRSQATHPIMRDSGVIFKRQLDIGTVVDLFLIPTRQDIIQNTPNCGDNKYGLLYLGNLRYPYSPNYINIYSKSKLIDPSKIDILSDKLIRIHDVEMPFVDLRVESNLTITPDILDLFVETYHMTNFEKVVEMLFKGYDYSNDSGDKSLADSVFESFVSGVDSNGKIPNDISAETFTITRFNPYINAYIMWFLSDKCDSVWDGDKPIPQDVLEQLEIYYDGVEQTNRDIIIRGGVQELFYDTPFTSENYIGLSKSATLRAFLEYLQETNQSPQEGFANYDKYPISNVLYKEDLVRVCGEDLLDIEEDIVLGGRCPQENNIIGE